MQITTQYEIAQIVNFLGSNGIQTGTIETIDICIGEETMVNYVIAKDVEEGETLSTVRIPESLIGEDKQSLLEKL